MFYLTMPVEKPSADVQRFWVLLANTLSKYRYTNTLGKYRYTITLGKCKYTNTLGKYKYTNTLVKHKYTRHTLECELRVNRETPSWSAAKSKAVHALSTKEPPVHTVHPVHSVHTTPGSFIWCCCCWWKAIVRHQLTTDPTLNSVRSTHLSDSNADQCTVQDSTDLFNLLLCGKVAEFQPWYQTKFNNLSCHIYSVHI